MQLLVCYGFVLIFDDAVKIVWGVEFKSMGMPPAFQMPPLFIVGGVVPPFYLFLIGAAFVIGLALWLIIDKTRLGETIRAAAHNPCMVAALSINTGFLYGLVFALGGLLAGFAGALAAPVRSLTPGMGFSILIESLVASLVRHQARSKQWEFSGPQGRRRSGLGGPGGDAAWVTRCGGACQAGEARALAAAARCLAAQPQVWAAGHADAIATLMRRTLTRTRAPIFSSFRRMVPQVALANGV